MEEQVYLNGSLIPRSEAYVSISDHGFLYGYGLFETMRAYQGQIFLSKRHIKRLLGAADTIGLKGLDAAVLTQACMDTLAANKLKEARVRITITGGDLDVFPWEKNGGQPTVVITARPYHPFPPEKYEQGFKIGIASVRRSRQSVVATLKSTNYLINVMALQEAAAHKLDEALLLNDGGYIAEGGGCNVFFVGEAGLMTPGLDSGILPGVTRDMVLELAQALGIKTTEENISPDNLKKYTEAFLTNSIMEIMPLVAVRDETGKTITIGQGKPGLVTHKLMAIYKKMVERETRKY
jgi:branched-chain amino acid aminotransferase